MSNVPRNPERPFNAKTCEEAMARLREAERGSPLVSKRRNTQLVAQAQAQVEKLCLKSQRPTKTE